MKTTIAVALAATLLTGASLASADTRTPRAHERQVRQEARIERNFRRGGLNAREMRRLERGHWRIRREIARAKADGIVTRGERLRIQRMQNRMNWRIWRQAHDRQRRV